MLLFFNIKNGTNEEEKMAKTGLACNMKKKSDYLPYNRSKARAFGNAAPVGTGVGIDTIGCQIAVTS